ncbi:putative oxidoreductase [Ensifer sp. M14]|uniref:SDR family NAD(P)-dependent oxidoreductase n=1 Tax=Sinorhizobium/Ensifer group TaxID=227292 RepID=UPI0009CD5662|nr:MULTISPECIES: SDR family NAD(P)-dependent oxidoreductase [Sinorhizobium/Ensifer group]OOG69062.1 oxidoreductase [Sinorhizobium sp. A49]RDL48157.1 putative oxidoreductase [Ensifer sp. M14]
METTRRKTSGTAGTAWVTGASSGIGRALAVALAREGWAVAISARSRDELLALEGVVPGQIFAFPLDVTNAAAVAKTFGLIEDGLGPVDLAVFSAGTYARDGVRDFNAARFSSIVNLNLLGTVHCLEAAMAQMLARGSGHIAVVASTAGLVGLPGAAAYGASKAALIATCEALYPDLRAQGIYLSLINPGFVDTPLTKKNDFPMPFLVPADKAAAIIVRGLKARRYEIIFPWQMAIAMKALRLMPARLRFAITRRMLRD